MRINLLFLLFIVLSISSCVKEESDFIDGPQGVTYTSDILGIVLDEDGKPIKDAIVSFNSINKTTDENGVYLFKNVEVSSQHSHINIKKDGYFDGSRAFMTARKASIQLKNILLKKEFNKTFDSNAGGVVKESNMTVEFPSNAIVVESSGEPYIGQVQVAIKYMDPTSETIYNEMPGNLTGLNSAQAEVVLTTYGMISIEMQGTSGQKLQIASGKKVTISNKVPNDLLSKAPSTIPLWYFDENLGYWREEGEAQLINDTYVGEVGHFSCWNYDSASPSIIISGVVVDYTGNPINGIRVIININGTDTHFTETNPDGTFNGRIEKGTNVVIKMIYGNQIYGCNSNDVINTKNYGHINSDTDFGKIVVITDVINNFEIKGKVVNCNGQEVQNGFVKIVSINPDSPVWYFPIQNGSFQGTIATCKPNLNIEYTAIDVDAVTRSETLPMLLDDNKTIGDVSTCDDIADFVSISNTEFAIIDTIFPGFNKDSASLGHTDISSLFGSKTKNGIITLLINLGWEDYFNNGNYNTGLFDLFFVNSNQKNTIQFKDSGGITQSFKLDEGTIRITKGGKKGETIIGEYDLDMLHVQTFQKYNFKGNFRIKNE